MQDDATKAVLDVELAGLVLDLSLLRIVAAQVSSSKAELGEGPLRGPSSIGAVEQRSTAPTALAAAGRRGGTSLDTSAGFDVLAGHDPPTSGGMIVEVVPFGAHGRCSMPHPDVLPAPALAFTVMDCPISPPGDSCGATSFRGSFQGCMSLLLAPRAVAQAEHGDPPFAVWFSSIENLSLLSFPHKKEKRERFSHVCLSVNVRY